MLSAPLPTSSELIAILDAVGTMIITTDLAGTVRIFNPAAERLLGWRAAEVIGKQTPALWHDPGEVALRAAELSRELGRKVLPGFDVFVAKATAEEPEQREWTFIRKDGSRFPAQLVVSAIRDAAGTITGSLGTAPDLTARVEAEQERDRLFNVSVDMLCIAGTDSYFKRVNPAFHRTLGWSEDELLARPFLEFVHPKDKAATIREVEKLAAGQVTVQFENRYRCKDGSWRWLSWNTMPQEDGLLYASARDISDLKRAEESLRQSRRNLEITLNSIGDAVIATDAARRITRMNPVAVQMTGWTVAEAAGRSIEEVFRIIHEETRDPAVIPVDDVLATGIVHGLANHTVLISRDGTERPIADSAAPIRDDAGQITGVVLVFRDVAEERRHERELQQLNADLERRIEERTRTLAESERRLRNGNRILEALSSDASLEQTLDLIARSVETEDPSALCSILLLDESGKHLLHG
ncbi:MAG: PAS domain S-box protein, partial [Pirellulaceae bacterium]|nr:PAS domain S-box protein [Pirellulaceae bacterium]